MKRRKKSFMAQHKKKWGRRLMMCQLNRSIIIFTKRSSCFALESISPFASLTFRVLLSLIDYQDNLSSVMIHHLDFASNFSEELLFIHFK